MKVLLLRSPLTTAGGAGDVSALRASSSGTGEAFGLLAGGVRASDAAVRCSAVCRVSRNNKVVSEMAHPRGMAQAAIVGGSVGCPLQDVRRRTREPALQRDHAAQSRPNWPDIALLPAWRRDRQGHTGLTSPILRPRAGYKHACADAERQTSRKENARAHCWHLVHREMYQQATTNKWTLSRTFLTEILVPSEAFYSEARWYAYIASSSHARPGAQSHPEAAVMPVCPPAFALIVIASAV